jgi:hypothetical protein
MRRLMTIVMLASGMTLVGSAVAADPVPATTQVTYNGMKVAVDSKTGALRPLTAAESRQLDSAMSGGKGLKLVTEAQAIASKKPIRGGGVAMKLPATLMSTMSAHVNADGTITVTEGDDSNGGASNE